MSKLAGLVDTFEKASVEADLKRQVVADLTSQLSGAKGQLETAENNVRSAKADLEEEMKKATDKLEIKGQEVTSKG